MKCCHVIYKSVQWDSHYSPLTLTEDKHINMSCLLLNVWDTCLKEKYIRYQLFNFKLFSHLVILFYMALCVLLFQIICFYRDISLMIRNRVTYCLFVFLILKLFLPVVVVVSDVLSIDCFCLVVFTLVLCWWLNCV